MMGTKERRFAPLINVSVEELVPQDHFYRTWSARLICRSLGSSCSRAMQGRVESTRCLCSANGFLKEESHD
jgi:hypothetical protein